MTDGLKIHQRGYWESSDDRGHAFDKPLCQALISFFVRQAAARISLVDFGCGPGSYTRALREAGIQADGFDGNPNTTKLSQGLCRVLDLSMPCDLGRRYDWVLSLEVGEHIPRSFESVFLANLDRHCVDGIVVSWAIEGQPGDGHINCRNNDYIRARFWLLGYQSDTAAEEALRAAATYFWFKNTIMVFRRRSPLLTRATKQYRERKRVRLGAYLFCDLGPSNFWSSVELHNVDQYIGLMKRDAFDTIMLVIPWAEFQPTIDPISWDWCAITRLRSVFRIARHHGMKVAVRLGYLWEAVATEYPTFRRYQSFLLQPRIREAWCDYVENLHTILSAESNFDFAFLSWEESYWPVFGSPIYQSTEKIRRTSFESSGFVDYALRRHAQLDPQNLAALAISDSSIRRTLLEFLQSRITDLFRQAEALFPGLEYEYRSDAEVLEGSSIRLFLDDQLGSGALRMTYFNSFSRGETDLTDNLDRWLQTELVDPLRRTFFISQFNFFDSSFSNDKLLKSLVNDDHARDFGDPTLAQFLRKSAELLVDRTAGFAVWAWSDVVNDQVPNSTFIDGTRHFQTSGAVAPISMLDRSSAVWLGCGSQLTIVGMIGRFTPETHPIRCHLKGVASGPSKLRLVIAGSVFTTEIPSGPFDQELTCPNDRTEARKLYRLDVIEGDIVLTRWGLYEYTISGGLYCHDRTPRATCAAVRELNEHFRQSFDQRQHIAASQAVAEELRAKIVLAEEVKRIAAFLKNELMHLAWEWQSAQSNLRHFTKNSSPLTTNPDYNRETPAESNLCFSDFGDLIDEFSAPDTGESFDGARWTESIQGIELLALDRGEFKIQPSLVIDPEHDLRERDLMYSSLVNVRYNNFCYRIRPALVSFGEGFVFAWNGDKHTFLRETYWHADTRATERIRHDISTGWKFRFLPPVTTLRVEEPVCLCYIKYYRGFGHFFFDILPRVLLAQAAGILEWARLFIGEVEPGSFQEQALELIGVSPDRLFRHTEIESHTGKEQPPLFVRFDDLVVPTANVSESWGALASDERKMRHEGWSQRYFEEIRRRAFRYASPLESSGRRRRLYLQRLDNPFRRLENEDEIQQLLARFGFEPIIAHDYSLREQIQLFSEASVVCGVHGSALTNILWMPSDGRVIEIVPASNSADPSFSFVAHMLGLFHVVIPARCVSPPHGKWSNVTVDPKALEQGLKVALAGL